MILLKCKLNHLTPTQILQCLSIMLSVKVSPVLTFYLFLLTHKALQEQEHDSLTSIFQVLLPFPLPHYEAAMLNSLLFLKVRRHAWALSTCSSCFPIILLACFPIIRPACFLTTFGSFPYLITLFKNKISLSLSILWPIFIFP